MRTSKFQSASVATQASAPAYFIRTLETAVLVTLAGELGIEPTSPNLASSRAQELFLKRRRTHSRTVAWASRKAQVVAA